MALIGEMKFLEIGSNTYEIPTSELPIASSSTLGGIKVGTNLSIDSSTGVLSASFTETDPVFSASAAAGITATDITNWNNKVSDTGKWNDVSLNKTISDLSNQEAIIPFLWNSSDTTARFAKVSKVPSYNCIAQYSGGYLNSTTPTSSDSSTKVATTAFVAGAVVTQASIDSSGLITYKNSGNTSLYTVQLPLFDGGTGSSSSLYLPLTGGSLSGNLSIGGTTTSTGLITGSGGISTTVLTTSSNATVGGNLSVSGTTTSTGLLTANGGISTTTLTTSGNTTVGNTLGVTGAATLGSTLDVTGDTTVNGVLDVTPRRAYASLSSEGWYRILKYSGDSQYSPLGTPSFIIRFGITRHASTVTGEAHEITLTSVYNGSIKFSNEISNSKTMIIDKIRYTYSGNNAYVDIHYNHSGTNIVVVDFDVYTRLYVKPEIVSQPFTDVGVSPSGETILAEYSFAKNTYDFEAATKDSNFSATTFNLNAYRRGDFVIYYYNISVPALAATTEVTMGTFSLLVPPTPMNQTAAGQAGGAYLLQFKANGTVAIYSTNGASAQFVRGTITIPVIH